MKNKKLLLILLSFSKLQMMADYQNRRPTTPEPEKKSEKLYNPNQTRPNHTLLIPHTAKIADYASNHPQGENLFLSIKQWIDEVISQKDSNQSSPQTGLNRTAPNTSQRYF